MGKYGFNKNEIRKTIVTMVDKDGFHREINVDSSDEVGFLPTPTVDGAALISVNGKWTQQPGYGYSSDDENVKINPDLIPTQEIDPEDIQQSVSDWLDDHPEATTTVTDGSITEAKLASAVAQKVNQVTSLSDEIDDIGSDVTDLKSAIKMNVADITGNEIAYFSAGWINTSVTTVDINTINTGDFLYTVVPCVAGEKFTISGTGASVARLWAFIASDGTRLTVASANETRNDYVITAPENSAYLVVNARTSSEKIGCFKGVSFYQQYLDDKVNFANTEYLTALIPSPNGRFVEIDTGTKTISIPQGTKIPTLTAHNYYYYINIGGIIDYSEVNGPYFKVYYDLVQQTFVTRLYRQSKPENGVLLMTVCTSPFQVNVLMDYTVDGVYRGYNLLTYERVFSGLEFEYGTLVNGQQSDSTTRIHSIIAIPVHSGDVLRLNTTAYPNYAIMMAYYDSEMRFVRNSSTGLIAASIACDYTGLAKIIIGTRDGARIDDFDDAANAIKLKESIPVAIDKLDLQRDAIRKDVDLLFTDINKDGLTYDYSAKCAEYSNALSGIGADANQFLFFTDPHFLRALLETGYIKTLKNYSSVLKGFYNRLSVAYALCGGDWLGAGDTKELALVKLGLITGYMREIFGDHYYPAYGNHDGNYQGASETDELSLNEIINASYPYQGKTYYSFVEQKARTYVFDTGTDWDTAMNDFRWEQVAWFGSSLVQNDDIHAMVCMHIVWNTASAESITPFADNIQKMIAAYNRHGAITLNGVTYNFTNCHGKIGFILCGHIHDDRDDTTNYAVPIIATLNTTNNDMPSFDLVIADWTNGALKLVRVGSGNSRTYSI